MSASQSEDRFRAVVRALPDIVTRLTDDGTVLDSHIPDAFATEFPAESLIGRRLHDVIPPTLAGQFDSAVSLLRLTGRPASYEYTVEVEGRTRYREVRMVSAGPGEVLSILRDVTELREKEHALEESKAELRALAGHLQDVREEERTRLSREVHDVIGQQLTAIRLGAGWFGRHATDDPEVQERLTDLRQTIDETIRQVRRIATDLRPGVLDDFGLASAVEWQAGRFEDRTGIECLVDVHGAAEPPTDNATAVFRVLQEALTNVVRHAEASRVSITLVLAPGRVRLVVTDDGRGFDSSRRRRQSLGLLGMRERAATHGGTLEVTGTPGVGTVVECTMPYASAETT